MYSKIKSLATRKGVSIYRLERDTSVGINVINRWDESMPSADKLLRVAKYLGTTVEELLKEESEERNERTTTND